MRILTIFLLMFLMITLAYSTEEPSRQPKINAVSVERQKDVLLADKDMHMVEGIVQKACPIYSIYKDSSGFIDVRSDDATYRIVIKDTTKLLSFGGNPISFSDIKAGKSIKVFYRKSDRPSKGSPFMAQLVRALFTLKPSGILTFNGKIEFLFHATHGTNYGSAFMVVRNSEGHIKVAIEPNTKLFDSRWNPISLDEIERGENVQVKYYEDEARIKKAESLRKL